MSGRRLCRMQLRSFWLLDLIKVCSSYETPYPKYTCHFFPCGTIVSSNKILLLIRHFYSVPLKKKACRQYDRKSPGQWSKKTFSFDRSFPNTYASVLTVQGYNADAQYSPRARHPSQAQQKRCVLRWQAGCPITP